jgi:hypothetical protein
MQSQSRTDNIQNFNIEASAACLQSLPVQNDLLTSQRLLILILIPIISSSIIISILIPVLQNLIASISILQYIPHYIHTEVSSPVRSMYYHGTVFFFFLPNPVNGSLNRSVDWKWPIGEGNL